MLLFVIFGVCLCTYHTESVSESQRLRPLWPDARADRPRKQWSVLCGTCAKRTFHTIHSIRIERRRREQAILMGIRHTVKYMMNEEYYHDTIYHTPALVI